MGERVPVTVQRVLNRLGQLAECIEGGQDAHSLLPGIGLIEREVACLGDEARIQTLEGALRHYGQHDPGCVDRSELLA